MNNSKKTFKIDSFALIVGLAVLVGILSVIFILITAQPKELKLIKWSAAEAPEDIIFSLSKRLFPDLSSNGYLVLWGLEKISLDHNSTSQIIEKVTNIRPTLNTKPLELSLASQKETSSTAPVRLILDPKRVDEHLEVIFEVYNFESVDHIKPDEFYDPQLLQKALEKSNGPLIFTAYKKNSNKIYVDTILLKSSQ